MQTPQVSPDVPQSTTPLQQPSATPYQQPPAAPYPPPVTAPQPQSWQETAVDNRTQKHIEHHHQNQAAGLPIWGILLILLGAVALFEQAGIGLGWVFGLAIGVAFVYLGVRNYYQTRDINWWLVGLGLLIGLGSITPTFAGNMIFPAVLIIVGVGILGQQYMARQKQ